ncbi:hypothetical protein CYMTET_43157 [Cymbomonas tetramitiformis]|uniref:WW domain-containing protein n=1 Tax=Cymbomonas tetramitiformis TaxID=36881 RepID=A0AAE0C2L2_9CHLO|nr:hypothetical protein CYMTET_43157 [Cymbomonas tetramitiformis]
MARGIIFSALTVLICCAIVGVEGGRSVRDIAASGNVKDLEELLASGVNPNDDGSEEIGSPTALWEAASRGDEAMTSLLLQFRANTSTANAKTLSTPLHIAIEKGYGKVVRLLLSYGAKVDAEDKQGRTPEHLIKADDGATRLLLDILSTHGPIGLEDPPGTWHLFDDENRGLQYYFNPVTEESRWMKPPSCAWRRLSVEDQPIYVNEITHQTEWVMPPALCWKKIELEGAETFWLNFKTNVTSVRVPAELPADFAQELEAKGSAYWFNEVTGESQWENPAEGTWNELRDDHNRRYWFKPRTGEATYKQPVDAAWSEMRSDEHNRTFYYNEVTEEITWSKPGALGWTSHDEL